jgi:hypothetical protein
VRRRVAKVSGPRNKLLPDKHGEALFASCERSLIAAPASRLAILQNPDDKRSSACRISESARRRSAMRRLASSLRTGTSPPGL